MATKQSGKRKGAFTLHEMLAIKSLRSNDRPLTKSQLEAFKRMVNLSRSDRRAVMDMVMLFGLVEKDNDKAAIIRCLVEEAN